MASHLATCVAIIRRSNLAPYYYNYKMEGRSFLDLAAGLDSDLRQEFLTSLTKAYITRYCPLPETYPDHHSIEELLTACSRGKYLLDTLLPNRERPTLGQVLCARGYLTSPHATSTLCVDDYSYHSLVCGILAIAKQPRDYTLAKDLLIKSLEEQLNFAMIFVSLDTLRDEILLTRSPTGSSYHTIKIKHLSLDLPICYSITEKGKVLLEQLLVAELAISYLLWQWLGLSITATEFKSTSHLTIAHASIITEVEYPIDLFTRPLPYLFKEELADQLINKYLASAHVTQPMISLFYARKMEMACLLAECWSKDLQGLDMVKCESRIRLYLANHGDLQRLMEESRPQQLMTLS